MGRYLYLISNRGLIAYKIDPTLGTLTQIDGTPLSIVPSTLGVSGAIDPTGSFLYISSVIPVGGGIYHQIISAFTINSASLLVIN